MEEIKLDLELKKEIIKVLEASRTCDAWGEEDSFYYSNWKENLKELGNFVVESYEELDVKDDGKYQYGGEIFRVYKDGKPTDMYIRETWSRSGSYFSDYYYIYDEIELVEPYTKTIEVKDFRVVG